jgi:hypothetical protein
VDDLEHELLAGEHAVGHELVGAPWTNRRRNRSSVDESIEGSA